jgi:hypothetical protein
MRIYKTVFVPTLLYGTESLIILDTHKNRMQTNEMKYLRKVIGKTRRDQIRNTTIRNQLKQDSVDGKENVEIVWTRSKDGFGKKTKISAGGKTRRRKR